MQVYLSTKDSSNKNKFTFSCVDMSRFLHMLKPTTAEILSGNSTPISIPFGSREWSTTIMKWVRHDGSNTSNQIIRSCRIQNVLLSRHGYVNGYLCRIEVLEEIFGELIILVYGIRTNLHITDDKKDLYSNDQDPIKITVGYSEFQNLQKTCDISMERIPLATYDVSRLVCILADRVKISPSKKWLECQLNVDMSHPSHHITPKTLLRLRRGPGAERGHKVINLNGRIIIATIYEIYDSTNITSLRISLYDSLSRRSIEYRLSAMEKVLYFVEDKDLLSQILSRIRIIYCNKKRCSYKMVLPVGDTLKKPIATSKDAFAAIYRIYNPDDSQTESEGAKGESSMNDSRMEVEEETSKRVVDVDANPGGSIQGVTTGDSKNIDQDWNYVISFNRGIYIKMIENIQISICIAQDIQSIIFQLYDVRTQKEECLPCPYETLSEYFPKIGADRIHFILSHVTDPVIVIQFLEMVGSKIMLKKGRREGLFKTFDLQLKGEKGVDPFVFGHLKEHILGEVEAAAKIADSIPPRASFAVEQRLKAMSIKGITPRDADNPTLVGTRDPSGRIVGGNSGRTPGTSSNSSAAPAGPVTSTGGADDSGPRKLKAAQTNKAIPSRKIDLSVITAAGLSHTSTFTTANVACFVLWNGVPLGHTKSTKNVTNLEWAQLFTVRTKEGQDLSSCSLDMEVYEMQGINKGAFLGCIHLAGSSLVSFFDVCLQSGGRDPVTLTLEKSSKLSDKENRYVKGQIIVKANITEQQNAADRAAGAPRKANKIDKFFGGIGGGGAEPAYVASKLPEANKGRRSLTRSLNQNVDEALANLNLDGGKIETEDDKIEKAQSTESVENVVESKAEVIDNSWEFKLNVQMSPLKKKIIIKDNYPYPMIRTPLALTRKHWRYNFITTDESNEKESKVKSENDMPLLDHRSEGMMSGSSAKDVINSNSRLPSERAIAKEYPIRTIEYSKVNKHSMDSDESRVCWRGCVTLKSISFGRDGAREAVYRKTSARLFVTEKLDQMKIVSELSYYDDQGKTDNSSDGESSLAQTVPIAVREIVSNGVGLVTRLYRIEVHTNTGSKIGSVDIEGEEDLRRVIGTDKKEMLMKKQLDLPAIFKYIVKNRLSLSFMPLQKNLPTATISNVSTAMTALWEKSDMQCIIGASLKLEKDTVISSKEEHLSVGTNHRGETSESHKMFVNVTINGLYKTRILTKWHKMSGTDLLASVFIQGSDPCLAMDIENFFTGTDEDMSRRLCACNFEIKVINIKNKIGTTFHLPGESLVGTLLVNDIAISLSSRLKRAKFGAFLLNFFLLEYSSNGSYELKFRGLDN